MTSDSAPPTTYSSSSSSPSSSASSSPSSWPSCVSADYVTSYGVSSRRSLRHCYVSTPFMPPVRLSRRIWPETQQQTIGKSTTCACITDLQVWRHRSWRHWLDGLHGDWINWLPIRVDCVVDSVIEVTRILNTLGTCTAVTSVNWLNFGRFRLKSNVEHAKFYPLRWLAAVDIHVQYILTVTITLPWTCIESWIDTDDVISSIVAWSEAND